MDLTDRVVRITMLQTTEKQRDTVAEHVLVSILCRTHTDPAGAREAITKAVDTDRLRRVEELDDADSEPVDPRYEVLDDTVVANPRQ